MIQRLVSERFQTIWDSVFNAMEEKFPDAYPSYLFRNVGRLKQLFDVDYLCTSERDDAT